MLTTVSPTAILKRITLSLTLFICTTLSIHFSAIKIPTPDVPCLQPFQKNLYLLSPPSNVLAFSPFHFVSCTQQKSSSLLPTISTTSLLLLTIVPTFTLPNLSLIPHRYVRVLSAFLGSSSAVAISLQGERSSTRLALLAKALNGCWSVHLAGI